MAAQLSNVLAQPAAVTTLRRALARDRVHHAYLFDGPDGVGKEMAAFGLAQALVCEKRAPNGEDACGACSACQRAIPREDGRTIHPDVIAIERGLYAPETIGRKTPELTDISVYQVRSLIMSRIAFPPHEGRAKVFVIRRAEELNPQAANTLLKTLEEPPQRTHFVLLSSQPKLLLPTIQSRTQRVRFAPLPDEVVAKLLVARGVDAFRAAEIAKLSSGSAEAATGLADDEASETRDSFLKRALGAIDAADLAPALELAEEAKKDKGGLPALLELLAAALAARVTRAAGDANRAADVAAIQHGLAISALEQLDGNASPQMVMESMLIRMRSA